jgi:flavin-dependent dehydrogenase
MSVASAPDVDVVIVGGGPAGSASALWCARQGLRVALLEREVFPRHRPGETLPPGVEPLFAQLGVAEAVAAAGFIRHAGTWVSWAGPRRFDPFGRNNEDAWYGFQAPREQLDRILLDAVRGADAVVRQPWRALHPLRDRGRVIGVMTSDGPLIARWVIDASGGAHWLARGLDIPLQFASPRLIARYGYVTGRCPERDDAPEIAADETGWSWSARIAPGLYHWTRLSLSEHDPLRDRPPQAFARLMPVGRTRGANVTWRIVSQPAGPGYLCVGDAAAVLDPASSHGVLKGLMSGMMAVHVISQATSGNASTVAATEAYSYWLREWFQADARALRRMYRELPNPPAWVRKRPASSAEQVLTVQRLPTGGGLV